MEMRAKRLATALLTLAVCLLLAAPAGALVQPSPVPVVEHDGTEPAAAPAWLAWLGDHLAAIWAGSTSSDGGSSSDGVAPGDGGQTTTTTGEGGEGGGSGELGPHIDPDG